MLITDEHLEFYSELYHRFHLDRYLEFRTYIATPRRYLERFGALLDGEEPLPLLRRQLAVRDRLDANEATARELKAAVKEFGAVLDGWERSLAQHRRIQNGHLIEPMKHHRHPR